MVRMTITSTQKPSVMTHLQKQGKQPSTALFWKRAQFQPPKPAAGGQQAGASEESPDSRRRRTSRWRVCTADARFGIMSDVPPSSPDRPTTYAERLLTSMSQAFKQQLRTDNPNPTDVPQDASPTATQSPTLSPVVTTTVGVTAICLAVYCCILVVVLIVAGIIVAIVLTTSGSR